MLTMCCSKSFMGTLFNLPSNSMKKLCSPSPSYTGKHRGLASLSTLLRSQSWSMAGPGFKPMLSGISEGSCSTGLLCPSHLLLLMTL